MYSTRKLLDRNQSRHRPRRFEDRSKMKDGVRENDLLVKFSVLEADSDPEDGMRKVDLVFELRACEARSSTSESGAFERRPVAKS